MDSFIDSVIRAHIRRMEFNKQISKIGGLTVFTYTWETNTITRLIMHDQDQIHKT